MAYREHVKWEQVVNYQKAASSRKRKYAGQLPEPTWRLVQGGQPSDQHQLNGINGGQRTEPALAVQSGVRVSNLGPNVREGYLKKLFEQIGPLRSCQLNYDWNRTFLGTADIVFEESEAAGWAVQAYHRQIILDGLCINVEAAFRAAPVTEKCAAPLLAAPGIEKRAAPVNGKQLSLVVVGGGQAVGSVGSFPAMLPQGPPLHPGFQQGGGGGILCGGREGQGQGGKSFKQKITVEQLDAELEEYMAEGRKRRREREEKEKELKQRKIATSDKKQE